MPPAARSTSWVPIGADDCRYSWTDLFVTSFGTSLWAGSCQWLLAHVGGAAASEPGPGGGCGQRPPADLRAAAGVPEAAGDPAGVAPLGPQQHDRKDPEAKRNGMAGCCKFYHASRTGSPFPVHREMTAQFRRPSGT